MVSLAGSFPVLSNKSLSKGRALDHQIPGPRHDVFFLSLEVSRLPLNT